MLSEKQNSSIENLFTTLGFPEKSYLHKRIAKKMFLENDNLKGNDKKLFRENVKKIHWEYTLKPSTCPILPFRDDEREYLEIAIIHIELLSQKGYKRIAETIHRIIPYPLILGFSLDSKEFAISVAPKRFSQVEHGAFVAEKVFITDWLNIEKLNEQTTTFIESLGWNNMPLHNYFTFYNAWIDRFIGYECSILSGAFTIENNENRLEYLAQCREIELRISELRGQLKKAAFNRQVELNIQIKQNEIKLEGIKKKL
jgi:hypothetical protein